MKKQSVTITLDAPLLAKARRKALTNRRSLSQQIALIIERELASQQEKEGAPA